MVSSNVTPHQSRIDQDERAQRIGQRGLVVWLTGLSGSGKSTLAVHLEEHLTGQGLTAFVLDGDNVRHGLCGDLGFSTADRAENIRRIGEVAHLFQEAGVIALCAFISPERAARERVRQTISEGRFLEVYVSTGIEVCESRDPKGLYARARAGQIAEFTGVSAEYEAPLEPDLVVDTGADDLETCVNLILAKVLERAGV